MDERERAKRCIEEIDLYERFLEDLAVLWRQGPFSDQLNELIDDMEALIKTSVCFDVEIKLRAILHMMLDHGTSDCDLVSFKKVARTLSAMRAIPSNRHIYEHRLTAA